MTQANLCQCNNCETILIDQNPQTGAKIYDLDELNIVVEDMQYLDKEDGEGGFWGCPVCMDDGYLNDEINLVVTK